MKRILITGGAGYMGSTLAKKLLDRGYYVRILDPLIFGKEPLSAFMDHPNMDLQVGLVEDYYKVDKCLSEIDVVVHLAGLSNDPSCELNAELTRKVNVDATRTLLRLSKSKGVKRVIYASSCSVYGFTGEAVVDEESPLNPLTAYAKSKVACEKLILQEASSELVTVCLRKATLYGPSPRMRFDLVINTLTGMAISEAKLIVNGGLQWRPFLHVEDAAEAYIFMLETDSDKVNRRIFNLGSDDCNLRIIDVANKVVELIPNVEVIHSDSPDERSYRVSFGRINAIGWKAKLTVDYGILGVKKMFDEGQIKDFRDLNYFNIKRIISYLNI